MNSGIYSITAPSGKRYIGSAKNFAKRWHNHLHDLRKGKHANEPLQLAFIKYGEAALIFEILECCGVSNLLKREQIYLDAANWADLYNILPTAGSRIGVPHSAVTRAKMSANRRGKPRAAHSAETRAKMAAAATGRVHTDATRSKLSAKKTGKRLSTNTSGFCGVCFDKARKTWRVDVRAGGERRHLGTYATPELAYAMKLVYLETWPYRENQ